MCSSEVHRKCAEQMFAEPASKSLPVGLSLYTILDRKVTKEADNLILVEVHETW